MQRTGLNVCLLGAKSRRRGFLQIPRTINDVILKRLERSKKKLVEECFSSILGQLSFGVVPLEEDFNNKTNNPMSKKKAVPMIPNDYVF